MLRRLDLGWVAARHVARNSSEGILSIANTPAAIDRRPHGGAPLPAAVLWDMDGTLVDTEP